MTTQAPSDGIAAQETAPQQDVPPLAATDMAAVSAENRLAESALVTTTSSADSANKAPAANTSAAVDNGQMAELKALINEAAHAGSHTRPLAARKVADALAAPIGELAGKIGRPYNITLNINLGQGTGVGV